jgi:ATP-binding cassette subfamily B protein
MSVSTPESQASADGTPVAALPQDVTDWLSRTLGAQETVTACLYADIAPGGEFGERWAFLTNQRLFVLEPNGKPQAAELAFSMPLEQIEEAELRQYVGSSALIVRDSEKGYEVARFSLGSTHEAADMSHFINQLVRERKEGGDGSALALLRTKHAEHRCPKCGRALRRSGEVCEACIDRRKVMLRLFLYLIPYKWLALGGLALTFGLTTTTVLPPYLTKVLVDNVVMKGQVSLFPIIVGVLIAIYVARSGLAAIRTYVMQYLGNRVLFDLRVQIYNHIQMLPISYYNQRQTGQIMSRVTGDLQRLQYFIAEGFQDVLVNIVTMVLIATILLLLSWKLFCLALAPVPIIVLSTWLFGRYIHLLYHRIWRRYAGLQAILTDTIPGIRVVKAFAQEKREVSRFNDFSAELLSQEMRAVKLQSGFFPLLGLLTGLGSILIFAVGGWMVIRGQVQLGVLIAFSQYLWQFYTPIQQFGQINHRLQHCMTSAERVFEVLDTNPEPSKYALDGVSFTVEPGEMIGLVGPSGAGKSTLTHLITRFYEVDEGEILIDGHNILDLDLTAYREQIGVVLQEPYLFHGPIWANIAYAAPEASAEDIIAAARAANAHEFILRMPDGYDTVIGERGQTLSGGERQRISIARAILRDPQILILDEATASVDTETEVMIQTALERLVQNRTTIAIAHRLSTLRKAHRLVVLEAGKLIEIGTHEELLETGGLYSRLCKLQSELSQMRAW